VAPPGKLEIVFCTIIMYVRWNWLEFQLYSEMNFLEFQQFPTRLNCMTIKEIGTNS
jgi:hypothetical protein